MTSLENHSSDPVLINIWSGPRSLSTSLMYSFSMRSDIEQLFDEPFYAYWLHQNPNVYRPYREKLLSSQSSLIPEDIMQRTLKLSTAIDTRSTNVSKIHYNVAKHVAKQVDAVTNLNSLICHPSSKHILLIRDPIEMMAGWKRKNEVHHEDVSVDTICLPQLFQMYLKIKKLTGRDPIVVDADVLKLHPKEVLTELCSRLNIPFEESQLSWPIGPKPFDGLWAPFWYDTVHKTTGFTPDSGSSKTVVTDIDVELLREALPFYEFLRRKAIGIDPLNPGSSFQPFHHNSSPGTTVSSSIVDHGIQMNANRLPDERNENLLIWIGNRLLPREAAKVSVFDSAVQGGDAVWEGVRVYAGKVFRLNEHITRLMESARSLAFQHIPDRDYIVTCIMKTLLANGMTDQVHMRITLTRGPKITSSMNPMFNIFGSNLLIVPEWKPVGDCATYDNRTGIRLITASNRRNPPQCLDSKIHHCNLINNILPKIQANVAGAADAIMLDLNGFVSETNATNIFMIKDKTMYTPHADSCLPVPIVVRNISLSEFYTADEVFTTGTMGELTPVYEIDGRVIQNMSDVKMVQLFQDAYRNLTINEGISISNL